MRDNVARIFDARAEAHPDRALFTFVGGDGGVRERYTYGSFRGRINHLAARLMDLGIPQGETALLVYPPGTEMAVAFFACIRAGIIPVPAPPPAPSKRHAGWGRLAHIARHARVGHVLSTTELTRRVAATEEETGEVSYVTTFSDLPWIATDEIQGRLETFAPQPSEILFLQYTSGSTSAPRGVAVTHQNVIHNAGLCVDHERPIGVSWLPHFHDMGLLGYFLFSVIKGGEAHCFSPLDFLRRPVLWLELISRTNATITTAPNAAFEYCLREDKVGEAELAGIDLSSLRLMVNAAEPVRAGTFERFWQRFSRHGLRESAYVAGYGLAEHTLCVTTRGQRRVTRESMRAEGRFVSCGTPAADVDLRIVDPETRLPVAEGSVGEIWVDSPSKASGYFGLPDLSEEHFQARIFGETEDRRYLRTGDLGFLDQGELFVCGRISDMLVVNGKNVFPGDIEALLEERFPNVLSGRVVAFGTQAPEAESEELVVLIEAGGDAPVLERLQGIVQDGCGIPARTVARVARGTILRTSSGKVARRFCREKWERGEVHPLEIVTTAESTAGTTLEGLIETLVDRAETLGNTDATLDQLGLDSVAFVNFSLALEEALDQDGLASPSLTEQVSDLSLLQALRVADLRAALAVLRGKGGAQAVLSLLDDAAEMMRADERARMRADAALVLPTRGAGSIAERGDSTSLLTGATGFLGAHMLRSLLELTEDHVIVVVRAENPAHGVARVRSALLEADMPAHAVRATLCSRLSVVCGDLTLPHLGLAAGDWHGLAERVKRVYHCGAEVDYVRSYNLLRSANVCATQEVISLTAEGQRKALHYVSTTFIFGWSHQKLQREVDGNPTMENLDFGYAQSKWVAEQLVRSARTKGLSTTIYRPAFVTASASGRFVKRDVSARVLGYMIRHGLTVDAPNQVSFLPVEICAHNIIALSRKEEEIAPVLHMTADNYHTIAEICRRISERFGYQFTEVSLPNFVSHAHRYCGPDDDLYPLLSFLDRNTARILRMGAKRYDSSNYRRARDREPLAMAHPSLEDTVDPIVLFLQREGLVPPAPSRSCLRGREAAAGAPA